MFILTISEKILSVVAGLGIIQGLFLAALIYFHPKSDRSVNIFLSLYVICLSVILCFPFMLQLLTWKKSFILEPFPVLIGPLLYLYARSFKEQITWRKTFPHLFLFVLFFILAALYHSYLRNRYPQMEEASGELMKTPLGPVFSSLKIGWYTTYYILTRRALHRYQQSIHHLYSDTTRIDLNWAKWLNSGTILLIVFTIAVNGLMYFYPDRFSLLLLINVAVITPYLYVVAYKGITQATLWQVRRGEDKNDIEKQLHQAEETKPSRETTMKPGPNDLRIVDITGKIGMLMAVEKLYQEPELSLQDLADKLNYPAYQVSQAINEGLQKSFYDLINGYRVEEAKRLLLDAKSRNHTILSVGFGAGFNSKTTFNTVFKKFTGLTPSEYRNTQNQEAVIS